MSIESFARHPLLFGPSPVHRLDRLTRHLGGAQLWAKREDCNSGIAFGGNKTRKLEYLVADALAKGCDTLVSIGGVQSNHTRQVAAVAASVGLRCVLLQESWVDWPDSVYDKVGNILLSRLAGADVRLVRAGFGIGFKESWERALQEVTDRGGSPYAIPAGASDHELGGLGFARWAYEVAEQERQLAEVEQRQAEARASIESDRNAIEAQLTTERARREQVARDVPRTLLSRYEKVRSRRRSETVFPLRGQSCSACDTAIPTQRRAEMAATGALEMCEGCGALLYAPE